MYTSQWTLRQLRALIDDDATGISVGGGASVENDKNKSDGSTKVLVLINENSPVLSPLLFLKKKGYKVKIIHKLSEAISEVTKNRPDILMISWNLKRVDVRKIYILLTKNFNMLCCIFGEENNPKTSNTMMRSGIPHAIFPPISGPGVHMRLQALLKGREEKQRRVKTKMQVNFEQGDIRKKTKSGYQIEKQDLRFIKSNPEFVAQQKTPLFRVMSNLKDVPKNAQWSEVQQVNENSKIFEGVVKTSDKDNYYYFKGSSMPVLDSSGENWTIPENKVPVVSTEQKADERIMDGLKTDVFENMISNPQHNASDMMYFKSDEAAPAGNDLRFFDREQSKMYEAVQEGIKQGPSFEYTSENTPIPEITNPGISAQANMNEAELRAALEKAMLTTDESVIEENIEKEVSSPTFFSGETNNAKKDYNVSSNAQIEFKTTDPTSILAKCVKSAVESIAFSDKTEIKELSQLSTVTLTVIKSEFYKGYLLGANASDICDRDLMKKVIDHLNDKMKLAGHPLEPVTGILELQFDALPFMLWAEKKADFFVKSNYGDEQVAFAYIPEQDLPQVEDAQVDQLLKVKLPHILKDEAVLFDVYIHMPKNNKYLLYLKKGSIFTASTINKLSKFAVEFIYIKRSELNLYYTYCAKYKFLESAQELTNKKVA